MGVFPSHMDIDGGLLLTVLAGLGLVLPHHIFWLRSRFVRPVFFCGLRTLWDVQAMGECLTIHPSGQDNDPI